MPPRIDFSMRADPADLPEWMDAPCPYEQFRDTVRDIGAVNRWTGAYRPTLKFLETIVARRAAGSEPLRVLDVGSGGGDALRRIALWAKRRGLAVELTGVDLNPHATRAATEFSAGDERFAAIRWYTGDAYTAPAAADADVVMSSLVTHHMSDGEIVQFLRWMEDTAREGWFVNDLLRSRKAYGFFRVLAPLMRWHPFVQHDGLVSIRRAFRVSDWRALLGQAGIPTGTVHLAEPVPGRLCLARVRRRGADGVLPEAQSNAAGRGGQDVARQGFAARNIAEAPR